MKIEGKPHKEAADIMGLQYLKNSPDHFSKAKLIFKKIENHRRVLKIIV
ncbi:MAG: hypothetical protein R2942_10165 [Ignavibacteria bacterium]